ncbi:MAG TPA: hypothetical protein VFZ27_13035 [Terriglobia bacterium]|nr:hypothetical protein [Terriglobia bacterium]
MECIIGPQCIPIDHLKCAIEHSVAHSLPQVSALHVLLEPVEHEGCRFGVDVPGALALDRTQHSPLDDPSRSFQQLDFIF